MYKLKSGKDEIVYLLTQVIEKYQLQTGQEIVQNTNRKNYEGIAIALSEITTKLPLQWKELGTDTYPEDSFANNQTYPYRKYDITGGQIKDALNGIVANPRFFLVDACYIYLYGVGRKLFELKPLDDNLLVPKNPNNVSPSAIVAFQNTPLKAKSFFRPPFLINKRLTLKIFYLMMPILIGTIIFLFLEQKKISSNYAILKRDMNILPYQPTQFEVDSLEGVWLCYTGSPQARISDPQRFHKVVSNLVEIKYKNGYFLYNRFGASFNHTGFVQFESAGILSVYSRIKNNSNKTESPRHSLLNLNTNKNYLTAISASWNFDIGDKNKIIGIREIYIKQGKGGKVEEIINEIENASCKCKIIRWVQPNNIVKSYYLKNEVIDSIDFNEIKPLINEKSILLSIPQDGLIIENDSVKKF